jgi:inhibitor of KinA sporulation pathway (predicted exonuclease)
MKQEPKYLAVLDFEATCDDGSTPGWRLEDQEIIELPIALVDIAQRKSTDSFGTFVRPTRQPILTPFCTELTTIKQSDVDTAPTISEAIAQLDGWLEAHSLTPDNTLVVTCGDWDLKQMWPRQRRIASVQTPALFQRWCNIKRVYRSVEAEKARGMMGMLRRVGLEHVGVHHRGADDVRNLANLACVLLERGGDFTAAQ